MLLLHQAGAVKVGEIVRYTLTYTPSADRVLPIPSNLYLRIKNTSAIPLRAAYLHGPYTLHVCSYPSSFNPNQKVEDPSRDGVPQFEPNLKAGSSFDGKLVVPERVRDAKSIAESESATATTDSPKSAQWIIEVSSQILFSTTATVHFEVLVGREERSLDLGFAAIAGKGHGEPGQVHDYRQRSDKDRKGHSSQKGVYSQAVDLVVEDADALWNKPSLPQWEDENTEPSSQSTARKGSTSTKASTGPDYNSRAYKKPKKVHLVILTHGLHSNIGADMLYMKESIDATVKQARIDRRERKDAERKSRSETNAEQEANGKADGESNTEVEPTSTAPLSGGQDELSKDGVEDQSEEDEEEVIVRGFPGNVVRTERGIQYLGKRLAKYILKLTYPDQPFLPESKTLSKTLTQSFTNSSKTPLYGRPAHAGSTVHKSEARADKLPYTFTSISFVGHSLGGLVQTYAIAYIHKHAPEFFAKIKPVNFVCMASPLLGLSNENPMYVKFALDFGLVGRTGQDLGLTWNPPAIARSGWSAMFGGSGNNQQNKGEEDPRNKPLLRILPTGPAHQILQKFRNRTVYSNVVNDGIVPLRTSCLLFLDWRGLDRVDNARRGNGLISTMASFGWNELTGANTVSIQRPSGEGLEDNRGAISDSDMSPARSAGTSPTRRGSSIPQPFEDTTVQDTSTHAFGSLANRRPTSQGIQNDRGSGSLSVPPSESSDGSKVRRSSSPFNDFFSFFRPSSPRQTSPKPYKPSNKTHRTYRRAQVLRQHQHQSDKDDKSDDSSAQDELRPSKRPPATRGDSLINDPEKIPPPKTSVFEAAADILNPSMPPRTWLLDPSTRSRTVFHDRIYHPDEIPPPPPKRAKFSSTGSIRSSTQSSQSEGSGDSGNMRVEEKIARAYHRDLSWRKVLVRLEPDAHNNMIVRRMFANAYGWDVVKHVCDTHFADTYWATTRDDEEGAVDRAAEADSANPPTEDAEEVAEQISSPSELRPSRTGSELKEVADQVPALKQPSSLMSSSASTRRPGSARDDSRTSREDSDAWNDAVFEGSEDDADTGDEAPLGPFEVFQRFWQGGASAQAGKKEHRRSTSEPRRQQQLDTANLRSADGEQSGTSDAEIAEFLTKSPVSVDSHRGLGLVNKPEEAIKPTFEADAVEPLVAGSVKSPEEDNTASTGASPTSGIGLRKPPEARIRDAPESPTVERANAGKGVTEQVANLSLQRDEDGPGGKGS